LKFKLKKSEHLEKFQLFNKIDKLKLSTRENKSINGDSLIFHAHDNKLFIYLSTGVSAAYTYLCDFDDDFIDFAIDCNIFTNAFTNFPTDEIQFAFVESDSQLVFGNKKTRVSLKTSKADRIENKISHEFFTNDNIDFVKYDTSSFQNAIKFTSFSCAPDFEEHPYSSIMFFIADNKFNAQSSDKHRISIYGKKYENEQSFLLSKNQAELSLNFVDSNSIFSIHKNKLIICNNGNYFCTNLEVNSYQSVHNGFKRFFDSKYITTIDLSKSEFLKSLKFINNISGSHLFNLSTKNKEIILTSSGDISGGAADKIAYNEELEDLNVSYLTNHFMKILEVINQENISAKFYDFNSYTICILQTDNFNHIMFPME